MVFWICKEPNSFHYQFSSSKIYGAHTMFQVSVRELTIDKRRAPGFFTVHAMYSFSSVVNSMNSE